LTPAGGGSIEISTQGRVVVATLIGELDIANVNEIGEEIRDAITNDHAGLCLDLSEARYVDSAGVRMIFELVSRLEAVRQVMAVAIPLDAPVRRLIEVTSLASLVGICPSVSACVEHVEAAVGDVI
jgi:anti-anti-sigma factor